MKIDKSIIIENLAMMVFAAIVGLSVVGCEDYDFSPFQSENEAKDFIMDEYLDVKHYCFGEMDEEELKTFFKAKERIDLSFNPQGYYEINSMNSKKYNMSDSLLICILNMYKKTNSLLIQKTSERGPRKTLARRTNYNIEDNNGEPVDCAMHTIAHVVGSRKSYDELVSYADSLFLNWRNIGITDEWAEMMMRYSGLNHTKINYKTFCNTITKDTTFSDYPPLCLFGSSAVLGNRNHFVNAVSYIRNTREIIYYDYQNPSEDTPKYEYGICGTWEAFLRGLYLDQTNK